MARYGLSLAGSATRADRRARGLLQASTVGLFVLLLVSLLTRLWYSQATPLSYDETHNLMFAVLAQHGHAPYREIYVVIAPFALLTMEISAWLWGATTHVRLLMMAYGLAGMMALFYLVRRQAPPHQATLAALLAGLFFSFNPHYFFVSTSINLEAGALAFALLSLAAAEQFRTQSRRRWILLSGVLFGLSATFKIFVPYLPAVIAAQMVVWAVYDRGYALTDWRTWRTLLLLGLLWTAGVLAAASVFLFIYDPGALIHQVLLSRFALREAIETDGAGVNIAEALEFADVAQFIPLMVGALAGLVLAWRARLVRLWPWGVWLMLALAFLFLHDPVRPRHLVTMLPPLAALSGVAVAAGSQRLAQHRAGWAPHLNRLLLGGLACLTVLAPLPLVETEGFVERHPARQAVIDLVQATTAPDDCIVTKENRLLFLAERLPTPRLSMISTARLFSGVLTAQDILGEIDRYGCPVLVYTDTFDQLIPSLRTGAEQRYALRLDVRDDREPDHEIQVYTVLMDAPQSPSQPLDVPLGQSVQLRGVDVSPGPWQPGESIYVSTYWEALAPMPGDYKIFLHLVDEAGNQVQAFDHYPFEAQGKFQVAEVVLNPDLAGEKPDGYPARGLIPTSLWQPGHVLKETVRLPLPADLAPGSYRLLIGLYDEATMERLDVPDTTPDGILNQVEIARSQIRP
ncbi:MAG: hypothetical protein KatS3mg050_0458 [Litorilinea sp.]|nr:MAG: hypothetical protein KatS3mg050_0458 [Litorilinea sp.]